MSVLAVEGSLSLEAKWKKVWSRGLSWSCYLCTTCREVLKTFPYIEEFGFGGLKQAALDLEQKGKQQNEEIHP